MLNIIIPFSTFALGLFSNPILHWAKIKISDSDLNNKRKKRFNELYFEEAIKKLFYLMKEDFLENEDEVIFFCRLVESNTYNIKNGKRQPFSYCFSDIGLLREEQIRGIMTLLRLGGFIHKIDDLPKIFNVGSNAISVSKIDNLFYIFDPSFKKLLKKMKNNK